MDIATLIFAGITLFFALRGFWLGLPAVVIRLLALVSGYLVAIFLAPGWVEWVDANTPLDGLAPYPATLLAAFFGAAFLVNLIGSIAVRLSLPEERRHAGKLPAVLINGSFGAIVALIAVWCYGLLNAAIYPERAAQEPSTVQHYADKLVATAMAQFVSTLSPEDPSKASMTEQLMAQPVQTVTDLRYLTNHAGLNSLLRDPDAQRLLKRGDIAGLQNNRPFREMVKDEQARELILDSGFLPEGTTEANYPEALATQLSGLWQKVEAVREQPDFQAITTDPEFRKKLQEGNLLSLLNDKRTSQLADIVWSAEPSTDAGNAASAVGVDNPSDKQHHEQPATDIHRWQDSEGRWHFSDKPAR